MDPYLVKDMAYAEQQDREWLRSLAVEQRAAEILADPYLLDIAVGDQVYGAVPFEPDSFIQARQKMASATSCQEFVSAAIAFKNELERIATAQAEQEIQK